MPPLIIKNMLKTQNTLIRAKTKYTINFVRVLNFKINDVSQLNFQQLNLNLNK